MEYQKFEIPEKSPENRVFEKREKIKEIFDISDLKECFPLEVDCLRRISDV